MKTKDIYHELEKCSEETRNYVRAAAYFQDEVLSDIQGWYKAGLITPCPRPKHGKYCFLHAMIEISRILTEHAKQNETRPLPSKRLTKSKRH